MSPRLTPPRSYDRLLALIQQLYAAPGSQDGWIAFLDSLCDAVDASCAHFIALDPRDCASVALTVRTDSEALVEYRDYWHAFDPWGRSRRLQEAATGTVVLRGRGCGTRLRALLAEVTATSRGQGTGAGGALAFGRPSGRRPLMAFVAPLTRRLDFFSNSQPPVAMVIVSDPERVPVPDAEALRGLFGLTSGEAALTRLVAQGVTLEDAAVRLGLRVETVRTLLKTIFEKTDTHRQADLVRLVLLTAVQP